MIIIILTLSYFLLAVAGLLLSYQRLRKSITKISVDDYHCSMILAKNLGQDVSFQKELVMVSKDAIDTQLIVIITGFCLYLLASGIWISVLILRSNWFGLPSILILNIPVFLISYRMISLRLLYNWFSSNKTSWMITRVMKNA